MEKLLKLLVKLGKYSEFRVKVIDKKEKYAGSKDTYDATIASLVGVSKSGKEEVISQIHNGKLPHWDAEQTKILKKMAKPLNDFKSYSLEESVRPLVNYWDGIRRKSVAAQKRKGITNPWKPAGNYTLTTFEVFISNIMIAKFLCLKDVSILDLLDYGKDTFEKDIYHSILEPLDVYVRLNEIIESESDMKVATEKIVDEIIGISKKHRFSGYNLLDPYYPSNRGFITKEETRELNSLFGLYEKLEDRLKGDKRLNKIERRLKLIEFWDSPQGKRLNDLNSLRVHGGNMTFEEREQAKRDQLQKNMDFIRHILESWEIPEKYIKQGLQYYQDLYEEAVYERYVSEANHKDSIDSSRKQLEEYGEIFKGIWNGDHLNFIGILLGLAIGFALAFAPLFKSYQWLWGIGIFSASSLFFVALFKCKFTKKILSKISKWVLE